MIELMLRFAYNMIVPALLVGWAALILKPLRTPRKEMRHARVIPPQG